jgi:hypothetical protein
MAFASRNWEKPRIVGVLVEIRTGLLPKPFLVEEL